MKNTIKNRIISYVDLKIGLVEYIKFTLNKEEIYVEIKFNKTIISTPIPIESFGNIFMNLS